MIIGIGTDIIEIERIKTAIERNSKFLEKIFTEKEREYFKSVGFRINSIAGNFAGKEAVSKALGTGFRNFSMKDIEILRDELGKPIVNLYGNAGKMVIENKNYNLHISISHSRENAIAYAVLEVC
ncbi:holo-ACP synthase [uncultured Clostridium sp.]|uniref:holo-ACP synthase n=1 Tax=uncultured Clostridium sp. TaxID=59620 RepID=UPI0028EE83AE|nr:holo-ACP synthase [uncultured Clostridium sp.]